MLEFQELTVKEGARLRPYYETCDYRLCEYSLGVKLMWRDYLHPWFTEAAGCLITVSYTHLAARGQPEAAHHAGGPGELPVLAGGRGAGTDFAQRRLPDVYKRQVRCS